MCSNIKCKHNTMKRKIMTTSGCDIFPGVSCCQCRDFRP